ncbi:hypothetical protein L6452_09601 [Arctium lappa]|uniref:Uncharacterized protein n=1 Tax=Arctium lappa TaxID=4217 RepID=A0ACB9DKI2_ARCLA|nr:hypothetical protein L6452_09601 [Arctium lappa]
MRLTTSVMSNDKETLPSGLECISGHEVKKLAYQLVCQRLILSSHPPPPPPLFHLLPFHLIHMPIRSTLFQSLRALHKLITHISTLYLINKPLSVKSHQYPLFFFAISCVFEVNPPMI